MDCLYTEAVIKAYAVIGSCTGPVFPFMYIFLIHVIYDFDSVSTQGRASISLRRGEHGFLTSCYPKMVTFTDCSYSSKVVNKILMH
jgi:hypothetical protein